MTSDISSKGVSDDRFIGAQDVKISQYFGSVRNLPNDEAVKIPQRGCENFTILWGKYKFHTLDLLFISLFFTIIVLIAN